MAKKARAKDTSHTAAPDGASAETGPDLLDRKLDDRTFEILFLEGLLPALPNCVELLMALAEDYTAVGLNEKGLALDRRLTHLRPCDPVVHYNLACSLSLVSNTDESLESLTRAIRLGYNDLDHMRTDPDLENVRRHPRFEMLLEDGPE